MQLLQDTALQDKAKKLSARYPGFVPQQAIDRVVEKLLGGGIVNPMNKIPERAEC
jgi:hypothetical protein